MNLKFIEDNVNFFLHEVESKPVASMFFYFISTTILRSFLEVFSESINGKSPHNLSPHPFFEVIPHNIIAFHFMILGTVLFIKFSTREKFEKILNTSYVAFTIALIVPVIDILTPSNEIISYLRPSNHDHWQKIVVTMGGGLFFKDNIGYGVTLGQKIEVVIFSFLTLYYVKLKSNSILKGVFCALTCYSVVVLCSLLLYFDSWVGELLSFLIFNTNKYGINTDGPTNVIHYEALGIIIVLNFMSKSNNHNTSYKNAGAFFIGLIINLLSNSNTLKNIFDIQSHSSVTQVKYSIVITLTTIITLLKLNITSSNSVKKIIEITTLLLLSVFSRPIAIWVYFSIISIQYLKICYSTSSNLITRFLLCIEIGMAFILGIKLHEY